MICRWYIFWLVLVCRPYALYRTLSSAGRKPGTCMLRFWMKAAEARPLSMMATNTPTTILNTLLTAHGCLTYSQYGRQCPAYTAKWLTHTFFYHQFYCVHIHYSQPTAGVSTQQMYVDSVRTELHLPTTYFYQLTILHALYTAYRILAAGGMPHKH